MDDDDLNVLAGYDALMGAARRATRRAAPRRRGAIAAPMQLAQRAQSKIVNTREQKLAQMAHDLPSGEGRVMRQFLGMPIFTFSAAVGLTTVSQSTLPLRSIQLDRVVLDFTRTGTTATGLLTVSVFKIGAEDMLCSNDPLPLGMFAANVTSGKFKGYTAKAGIPVFLSITTSTLPGSTDHIDVSFGAYGDAVAG